MLKIEIRKEKAKPNERFHNKIRNLKVSNSKEYWKLIKSKKSNNVGASISDLLSHFKNLNENKYRHTDNSKCDENTCESSQMKNKYIDCLNNPIEGDEIIKAIGRLKNGKSCGSDGILNEYIINTKHMLLPLYTYLFNKVINDGEFPESWSTGIIIPIFKNNGKTKDPNCYRGITLLSCLSKLFTSVINNRLNNFIEENKILNENQAGFRKGYSTIDNIFLVSSLINLMCSRKKKLFCAFVDYPKAFDSIWREALWSKLLKEGISGKIINLLKSMYSKIRSCVMVNGVLSEYFVSFIGLREGENLSPILFSLFINDLEEYLLKHNETVNFNDALCNEYLKVIVLFYADDTVIFADSPEKLQNGLNDLEMYYRSWRRTVNPSKTKAVVFGNSKIKNDCNFVFNNQTLENVYFFKYLGIIFNYNGKFELCKKYLCEQASEAMFTVLSNSKKLNLPTDIQLDLFDKLILPILTYGSEIWGYSNVKGIETVQTKFVKYVLHVNKSTPNFMVLGESGKLSVTYHIQCKMINFWLIIINGSESKMVVKMYKVLHQKFIDNSYKSPWLKYIHKILINCGLGNIWAEHHKTSFNPK